MTNSLLDQETEPSVDNSNERVLAAGISAIIITLFLFFIDEGYNNFKWMREAGNWFAFIIYVVVLFPVLFIISNFAFKKLNVWRKILALVLTGFLLCLIVIFGLTKII